MRVYAGRDPVTGKKKLRTREFRGTYREAETAQAAFVTEMSKSLGTGRGVTVAALLQAFVEHSERIGRSPTTLYEYRRMAKVLEKGAIGRCALSRLKPKHLDDLYGRLATVGSGVANSRGPLSAASVNRYHDFLKAACAQGVRWGWLDSSPVDRATPPTERRKRVPPPTPAELGEIIRKAAELDTGKGVLLALAATTGARRGELCALRWSDVDLDAGVLHIRRALKQAGGVLSEGDTKTHQERSLAIHAELVELLAGYQRSIQDETARGGFALAEDPYLFSPAADYGRPYKPDSISNFVNQSLQATGGTKWHLHQLRHFAATQLIAGGTDVATVSRRLGHSNTSVTLDIYTHVIVDRDRDAAVALGAVVAMPELAPGTLDAR